MESDLVRGIVQWSGGLYGNSVCSGSANKMGIVREATVNMLNPPRMIPVYDPLGDGT